MGITVHPLVWPLYRPTSWVTLHAVLMISQPYNNQPYSISVFTNSIQMWGREGPAKCQFYKFLFCTVLQNSRTRFFETDDKKPGDYFLSLCLCAVFHNWKTQYLFQRMHICFLEKSFLLFCFSKLEDMSLLWINIEQLYWVQWKLHLHGCRQNIVLKV